MTDGGAQPAATEAVQNEGEPKSGTDAEPQLPSGPEGGTDCVPEGPRQLRTETGKWGMGGGRAGQRLLVLAARDAQALARRFTI